ncbi:MAG: hypothetical protein R3F47_08480 [Gammaproteobacteria bacterium]
MDAFLTNIFTYPTAIFTVILGVAVIYWLFAILGLVDMDVLDVDVDLDTDLEGLTGLAGLLVTLGLTGVPVTVVVTVLALLGWLISYFAVHLLFFWPAGSWLSYAVGTVVIPVALAVSVPVTAQIVKPLKPLFRKAYANAPQKVLMGQPCLIRSTRVDMGFGEATATVDGASLILKVRADPAKQLKKGDRAVLIEYRAAENSYLVVPESEFSK